MDRACGVLLPIFSLPSKYGIGCFSKEAYEFVDFLKKAGQTYWQILPLGPTSYGDSPYQAFSTFAGNPYFIDLEELIRLKWLSRKDCEAIDWGQTDCANGSDYVNYEKMYLNRFKILKKAFKKSDIAKDPKFNAFVKQSKEWLIDYATYMAIKDAHGGVSYLEWEEDIRLRKPGALKKWQEDYKEEILFYEFQQYLFFTQWKRLKEYANRQGIKIIGDLPIYVSLDSADTWANPELFWLDENRYPVRVAGCPPDYFSADGQLWGNPLYAWEYHQKTGYAWWLKRFKACFELFDIVRIDHFRGFASYYTIPYGHTNARKGQWLKGPGWDLFKIVKEEFANNPVIAEDLGFITADVRRLIKRCGYPGMKILIYGFDEDDISEHSPIAFEHNCVVYSGTHDNDTIASWFKIGFNQREREYIKQYMGFKKNIDAPWAFIRSGMSSVADTAIFPLQDYLKLGIEAKINTPSTIGDNWKWRLIPGKLTEELAQQMKAMAKLYHRIPKED